MKRTLFVYLVGASLLLTACSSENVVEKVIESEAGVDNVEIDEEDGTVEVQVEGQDGEEDASIVIGGGEVPDDWPIPVPSGGEVLSVMESGNDKSIMIEYANENFDSLVAYYEDYIDGPGTTIVQEMAFEPPKSQSWVIEVDGSEQTIMVIESANGAQIQLFVTEDS